MTCKNKRDQDEKTKNECIHSGLCSIEYPHKLLGPPRVRATRLKGCTMPEAADRNFVLPGDADMDLGYEANMDLVSPEELNNLMGANAKFGTYLDLTPEKGKRAPHLCVDKGRKSVDGRRLAWLWVFPDGVVKKSGKLSDGPPQSVWTKAEVLKAWRDAGDETLSMWTRHVEWYCELAITFCLPAPSNG